MKSSTYVIYLMSNSPYQQWQAELLEYSFQKVSQPGKLIRICSEDSGFPGRSIPLSKAGRTIATPNYSRLAPGIDWPVMNKPGAIKYFLERYDLDDNDTLIILDVDMVFLKAWDPEVTRGHVYGQKWKGYTKEYCQKTSIHPELCPENDQRCIMSPFVIKAADIKRIAGDVKHFAEEGYLKFNSWMADMSAFQTAMVKHDLVMHPVENIGLCNNWDNNNDPSAPIMHYCQEIKDKDQKEIWYKRSYKPWRSPPDSSSATNRVDRETLEILREFAEQNGILNRLRDKVKEKRDSEELFWKLLLLAKDAAWISLDKTAGLLRELKNLKDPALCYYKYRYGRNILSSKQVQCGPNDKFSLHVLTCRRDLLKTLWSIKTFHYYSGLEFDLFIHSDGSLKKRDNNVLSKHFKNCRIIDRKEADSDLDEFLKDYRYCSKYRKTAGFYCSLKLFDSLYYSSADNILYLDSDLLFFKRPAELISCIDRGTSFFNSDMKDEYSYDPEMLNKLFNLKIPDRFNAGLICFNRNDYLENLGFMESYFQKIDGLPPPDIINRHEQTLHALLAAKLNSTRLGPEYQPSGREVTDETVSCHFFSGYRPDDFYRVGLKLLKSDGFPEKIE